MPKLIRRLPKLARLKASGQAIVTLEGRVRYVGTYGTEAARLKYDRIITERVSNVCRLPTDPAQITIAELAAAIHQYARNYYMLPDRTVGNTALDLDEPLRPLLKL